VKPIRAPKTCPRCQSTRVQRSHRRNYVDHLLHALGAEIRRCRECRFRHASRGSLSILLGDPDAKGKRWAIPAVLFPGFVVCIVLVLWVIRRLTGLSG
jgi:hypothetical protein